MDDERSRLGTDRVIVGVQHGPEGRQCEASLRRLQTDCIDLYQMHHIDRSAAWDELWEAFDVLKQQGKILYVGTSNFPGLGARAGQ